MNDFNSSFWSLYVIAIVVFGVVFCIAVLIFGANAKAATAEDKTTGHVWDGDLREINNPLPRWWVGLFWLTIVFAVGYLVLYPGLGGFNGTLKWSSAGQYEQEMERGRAQVEPLFAKYATMPVEEIAKDPQAIGMGQRLFLNNCAQCHGSDAKGGNGFPNLSDNDWLWGGKPEDIKAVANYVLSLSGVPHDAALAAVGKSKFAVCAACHGADGKGSQAVGGPNLTDNIWLHGFGEQHVINMINEGKTNIMPEQGSKFTPEQIRLLAAYVWGLSNNQQ